MKRSEPALMPEFAKDEREEDVLARMNALLQPLERDLRRESPAIHPQVFIAGTPRSGTTLLMQLLVSCLDLGFVNNLIARFWKAPLVGIRLSRTLLDGPARPTYRSRFGRTEGPDQPHEFGYFWSEALRYPDMVERGAEHEERIDWAALATTLREMADAFEKPLVSKPFLLTWHLARIAREVPEAVFVHIRRDPVDTALSLLRLRETLLGSRMRWASLRPKEHAWLAERDVYEQVAGQAAFLARSIEEQLSAIDPSRVVHVDYEQLCADPRGTIGAVAGMLRRHGAEARLVQDPPEGYRPSRPSQRRPADAAAVIRALERIAAASGGTRAQQDPGAGTNGARGTNARRGNGEATGYAESSGDRHRAGNGAATGDADAKNDEREPSADGRRPDDGGPMRDVERTSNG